MRVLYFAWLRERTGVRHEDIQSDAATVADLIAELRTRSAGHAAAFEDMAALRVAVDQDLCALEAPLAGVSEVAFFPPMTGG